MLLDGAADGGGGVDQLDKLLLQTGLGVDGFCRGSDEIDRRPDALDKLTVYVRRVVGIWVALRLSLVRVRLGVSTV